MNTKKNISIAIALVGAVAAAPALRAQSSSAPQQAQQPPSIAAVLNGSYGIIENEVVSAAEAMPEEKYGFAPTNGEFKGVRTFAEEVKHIGFANHLFFGPLMGETIDVKSLEQNTNGPAALKTKAEIVQYLKDSFALGHKAISTITAENQVTLLDKPVLPFLNTRLGIATIGCWHSMDHYGQIVEYLRGNGIIPPASRPRPPQQQAPAAQPKS
ncbi:MAG TPA: DinB family protein [Candidatus Acidoferrum sp.]|nr:DinB family protein [Candidatus Acidoferrum sp.]